MSRAFHVGMAATWDPGVAKSREDAEVEATGVANTTGDPAALPVPAAGLRRRSLVGFVPFSLLYVAEIGGTAYRALSSCLWERGRGRGLVRRVFLQQVYFTAVQALPLALFMAVGFGALLMIQASRQLPRFGMQEVEEITGLVLFREVAPLAVALIVIARSATAIVVEIGNMRVSGELRALEILGINLDRLIVLPRLLGMLVSMPLLATCFCAAALWGGYFLARSSGLLETTFVLQRLTTSLDVPMVEAILIRSVCFGLITGAVSCGHGLRVKLSPTEVPQQATRGVVGALTLCFLANLVLSLRGS